MQADVVQVTPLLPASSPAPARQAVEKEGDTDKAGEAADCFTGQQIVLQCCHPFEPTCFHHIQVRASAPVVERIAHYTTLFEALAQYAVGAIDEDDPLKLCLCGSKSHGRIANVSRCRTGLSNLLDLWTQCEDRSA